MGSLQPLQDQPEPPIVPDISALAPDLYDQPEAPPPAPPAAVPRPPDRRGDELRTRLVGQLRASGTLRDPEVERALLRVPRHLFLPQVPLEQTYADTAVPTHWEDGQPVSSASQPSIVALMLEQLRLAPGMRVLEIGAGTGYNAALLAEIVGPEGQVTTLDLDPQIANEAREHLAAAGYDGVRVLATDGWEGWAHGASYDRVILTVGASDISPAWFDQLADNGLLVLPLWLRAGEASVALRKRWGRLQSESLLPCAFMRLRGAQASAEQWVTLPGGRRLGGERVRDLAESIAEMLARRPRHRLWLPPSPALAQYLGLRGVQNVVLWPDPSQPRPIPPRGRLGIYVEDQDGPSLVLFGVGRPFLLCYGTPAAERALEAELTRWRGVSLPPMQTWSLTAYPVHAVDGIPPLAAGAVRLVRRHVVFDITPGTPGAN